VDALESGKVLALPALPFTIAPEERPLPDPATLGERGKKVSLESADAPPEHHGAACHGCDDAAAMMQRYADAALSLLADLLPGYAAQLQRARTSFRPAEIEGRAYSARRDDRRLHVDAFPTRPMAGRRILRVFCNVAPDGAARDWLVASRSRHRRRVPAERGNRDRSAVRSPDPCPAHRPRGDRSAVEHGGPDGCNVKNLRTPSGGAHQAVRPALLVVALAERRLLGQRVHIGTDCRPLLLQEIRDCPAQPGMRDPVRGVGRLRQIATLDFVPPLRAGFHALQAMLDRPIDRTVVAELEMQERPVAAAAPVAAVQRFVSGQVQRTRHRLAAALCQHQHDAVAQTLPQ
jgi:hypothetical protein